MKPDRLGNARQLKEPLADLWQEMIPDDCQVVVIHSSILHFRFPLEGLEEVLVESFLELVQNKGLTVTLPAFTRSFCGGKPYHHEQSKSETGLLADWVLKSGKAKRTPHPIYSFVVLGPLAEELIACKNKTTFGDGSSFEYFENHNTVFVMFGCGWEYCTQLHRYEELANVPYRFFKEFCATADLGMGPRETRSTMFVRNLEINAENDFTGVHEALKQSGKLQSQPFYGGQVESVQSSEFKSVCRELLNQDPLVWVKDKEEIARRLASTSH